MFNSRSLCISEILIPLFPVRSFLTSMWKIGFAIINHTFHDSLYTCISLLPVSCHISNIMNLFSPLFLSPTHSQRLGTTLCVLPHPSCSLTHSTRHPLHYRLPFNLILQPFPSHSSFLCSSLRAFCIFPESHTSWIIYLIMSMGDSPVFHNCLQLKDRQAVFAERQLIASPLNVQVGVTDAVLVPFGPSAQSRMCSTSCHMCTFWNQTQNYRRGPEKCHAPVCTSSITSPTAASHMLTYAFIQCINSFCFKTSTSALQITVMSTHPRLRFHLKDLSQ